MKYVELSEQIQYRHRSHHSLAAVLSVFVISIGLISNYLVRNMQTDPESTLASASYTCSQGFYDNFDSERLDLTRWQISPDFSHTDGVVQTLYSNEPTKLLLTTNPYDSQLIFASHIDAQNIKSNARAYLVGISKDKTSFFKIGFADGGYFVESVIDMKVENSTKGRLRNAEISSFEIERSADKVKFYYSDRAGKLEVANFRGYEGPVYIGFGIDVPDSDMSSAKFDNFELRCPQRSVVFTSDTLDMGGSNTKISADLNADYVVNIKDMQLYVSAHNSCDDPRIDFNKNGNYCQDSADWLIFKSNYQTQSI